MKTQNDRLLEYLKKRKKIDPLTAWQILGIYRLGARIYDLRAKGKKIIMEMVTVNNRFGEPCRVASYRLK